MALESNEIHVEITEWDKSEEMKKQHESATCVFNWVLWL